MKWLIRHHWSLSFLFAILTIIAFYFTVLLYKNLRTGIEELLPKTARSVVDLDKVTQRLESSSNLAILITSEHVMASKRFVMDLAQKLHELKNEGSISRVEYRIDRELEFFNRRRALFVDLEDLKQVRNYIQDRVAYEEALRNPLTIFEEVEIPEPRLDIGGIEGKYSAQASMFTRFPDGFYASPDQKMRVLLVHIAGRASGISNALKLRASIDEVILRLNPTLYAPDLKIHFTGDAQNLIEENNSLLHDLQLSAVLVPVLVLLAMIIYFRDWLTTLALVLSLVMGTAVALGLSYFLIGYLNANSAFLGSIVIGNGINFGIMVLARYLEERRRQIPHDTAITTACTKTWLATLIASLAAGLAYASLIATQFRGFRQFGTIGLIGMICCWISAYTVLPVLLTLAERFRPFAQHKVRNSSETFSKTNAWVVSRYSVLLLSFSSLLVVGAVLSVTQFQDNLFETDTTQLRDKTSLESGSGYYSRYLDEIFQRYISPVVILPSSIRNAEAISRKLKAEQKKDGPNGDFAGIYSLGDLVPRQQRAKIQVLREIRSALIPALQAQLNPRDRRLARSFLQKENFTPFTAADLPESIRARFREINGTTGKLVLVEPRVEREISRSGAYQTRFISKVRQITDSVEPGAPVVGQLPLTVDMQQSIRRDGPRATLVAAGAVTILVLILFRDVRTSGFVLLSLLLGMSWLAGSLFQWVIKINFLNFIAIPITFGIGVDYAINTLQRYRLEGPGSIMKALRTTGGAVALESLTTIIGYGSLLIAGNQGFVSFGKIAIIGEITCLFAALLTVPALIYLLDLHRRQTVQKLPIQEQERRKAA